MAEMASYVAIQPRTIQVGATALARGFRVLKDSAGVCAVADATVRGDFITLVGGAIGEYISAVAIANGEKVPAYAGEASCDAGDLAYAFAGGKTGVTSTNAALLGKWATTTAVNTLGEIELFPIQ